MEKISAIKFNTARTVQTIRIYWINNNGVTTHSPQIGANNKGTEQWLYLEPNEYITGAIVMWGRLIDGMIFTTNKGRLHTFGNAGGTASVNLDFGRAGYQMHGMYGRAADKIDQIGFYCYPNSIFPW